MTLTPLIPVIVTLSLLVPCQSLVTFSSAPGQRLRARPPLCVEVECGVQRTASGGLGIQVDERNAIATSDGQETLRAGDIIVAVDGVRGVTCARGSFTGSSRQTLSSRERCAEGGREAVSRRRPALLAAPWRWR